MKKIIALAALLVSAATAKPCVSETQVHESFVTWWATTIIAAPILIALPPLGITLVATTGANFVIGVVGNKACADGHP